MAGQSRAGPAFAFDVIYGVSMYAINEKAGWAPLLVFFNLKCLK